MPLHCSICLSRFTHPTCLPCGHIYCKKCIVDFVNSPANDGLESSCPECRAPFQTALRRVYIDFSAHHELEKRLRSAEKRLESRKAMEESLLLRCEGLTAALDEHRRGEAEANATLEELREKLDEVEEEYMGTIEELRARNRELEQEKKQLALKCARMTKDAGSMQSKIEKLERERVVIVEDFDDFELLSDSQEPTFLFKKTKASANPPAFTSISAGSSRKIKPLPKRVHRRSEPFDVEDFDEESGVAFAKKRPRVRLA